MSSDPINHPTHYTSSKAECNACSAPVECIDVTKHMSFPIGNAVKYLWRCDLKKDAIEDLRKAVWYINCEISRREKENNPLYWTNGDGKSTLVKSSHEGSKT